MKIKLLMKDEEQQLKYIQILHENEEKFRKINILSTYKYSLKHSRSID